MDRRVPTLHEGKGNMAVRGAAQADLPEEGKAHRPRLQTLNSPQINCLELPLPRVRQLEGLRRPLDGLQHPP
jgi:hypothetical protein